MSLYSYIKVYHLILNKICVEGNQPVFNQSYHDIYLSIFIQISGGSKVISKSGTDRFGWRQVETDLDRKTEERELDRVS